jgi:uncharacterized protein
MKIFYRIILINLVVLLSACGTSPKTNFYLLSAEHDSEIITSENLAIGVWKVTLPELIDRPEIVTRTGAHTINLADFHRWAGGLSSNVSFLIANELSYNLKTGQVDVSPWSAYHNFDYQIKIHIREFDGKLGGESSIKGIFVILNGKGDKNILKETFSFKEKAKDKSYSEMAAAMSRLVVSLSGKIAQAIRVQQAS